MAAYRLKGKTMHELVKRGFTMADFCAKYQCTEDELISQIRKILCEDVRAVNEILNEITVNEKRAGKCKSKSPETLASVPQPADTKTSNTEPVNTQPAKEEPLTAEQQREKRLAELNIKKQELMEEAKEATKRYAEADKTYSRCCAQLTELKGKNAEIDREISRLREQLGENMVKIEEVDKKSEQALNDRAEAMKEREKFASQIAKVSLEISELTAVQLIACNDGTIEAVDEPNFVMNEEGATEYYGILVHDVACSEFRMKDISLLARAMAIRNNSKDRRVVVTFDNECLTHYFART